MSSGTDRELCVVHYGSPEARPKAYLQASLHADELPAMLVASHLLARLDQAARAGAVRGCVTVVPVANPIGLAQYVDGRSLGRFALGGQGNFNRNFPDLADAVARRAGAELGPDAERNVRIIRHAVRLELEATQAEDDVAWLRRTLLGLAADADIALDLHCDSEAVMHLYLGTPLWPGAADLSAQVRSRATLLATVSGGSPFDEAVGGLWWSLAERFPDHPIPPACLSGTLELRGRADVSDELARADADNLFRFLQRRGLIEGEPGPLPEALCDATPLEGVLMVRAPVTGLIVYAKAPGERVRAGDLLATIVDPLAREPDGARTELESSIDGVLIARTADRLARPGKVVCKVAGPEPLPERASGHLLTD